MCQWARAIGDLPCGKGSELQGGEPRVDRRRGIGDSPRKSGEVRYEVTRDVSTGTDYQ